jgi:hypothetical protein
MYIIKVAQYTYAALIFRCVVCVITRTIYLIGRPSPTVFWGKEGETSVLFPGMKAGNVYVSADGSLKMKGLVVENSGRYYL